MLKWPWLEKIPPLSFANISVEFDHGANITWEADAVMDYAIERIGPCKKPGKTIIFMVFT